MEAHHPDRVMPAHPAARDAGGADPSTPRSFEVDMNRVRLGRSDLRVSRIAFGAWELGGDWGATNESAAIATIRHAADQGINFFDTAQGYGFGASERLIARALAGRP